MIHTSVKMRRALLMILPFFVMSSASAREVRSTIIDSVQLTVDGPAVQSTRIGSSYSVSGSNISVGTLGGLEPSQASPTNPATLITTSDYSVTNAGQAFTFSETALIGDVPVTTQGQLSNAGRFDTPNLYGDTTTYAGGYAGSLAGSLSATGVASVTAGGSGTTAVGQRTVELSVFQ
jgi:hypothetical protein